MEYRTKNDYEVLRFESIDSTNTEAKRQVKAGRRNTALYIADTQTNGRGRLGRSFYCDSGTGVYMSVCYYTENAIADALGITCAASVVVRNAILHNTGKATDVKWVNDLYYKGKKVCGILCEAMPCPEGRGGHFVIVGIGINVRKSRFPDELSDIAGSLDSECDTDVLIIEIADGILHYAKNPDDRSYMRDYRDHSMVLHKSVRCQRGDECIVGTVLDITDSGALILQTEDQGTVLIDSGEVSLRVIESNVPASLKGSLPKGS